MEDKPGIFDGDLTEISSGDSSEDDIPLSKSQPKSKAKAKAKVYSIQNALRPPRTTHYTATSLYDQIIDNTIDLDPEYQRDVVWPELKQSGLIDSVLRNYYIPPVIFAVSSSEDGSELRTCIDGKQRLTSIQRFMDGLIPYKDSVTSEKLWFKQLGNSKRKLLPEQYKKIFRNKQIVSMEYEGLHPDQEREIFQRVQLGVALTPAERLQALTGPWPTFVRELQDEVLGESGFEGHLDWGHARGRDYQCLATIALLIDKSKLVKKTYPGHPQLEKWLNTSGEVPAKFRNDVFNTMRIFVDLVKNFKTTFHKPNKLAPVEFVMVGLLVYTHRTKLSMTQLNSAIKEMRVDVRSQYDDIRSNTKVSRCLFEFIDKKVIASNLKSDMHGDKPAASIHHQKQNGARAKRKRSDSESSESETLKAPPRKSVPSKAGPSKHAASSSDARPTKSKASSSLSKTPLKSAMSSSLPSKPYQAIKPSAGPPGLGGEIAKNASQPVAAPTSQPSSRSVSVKLEASVPSVFPMEGGQSAGGSVQPSSTPGGYPYTKQIVANSQSVRDPRLPRLQTDLTNAPQQLSATTTPLFPRGIPLSQGRPQSLSSTFNQTSQSPSLQSGPPQIPKGLPMNPTLQHPMNGNYSQARYPSISPQVPPHVPNFAQDTPSTLQGSYSSLQNGYSAAKAFASLRSNSPTPSFGPPLPASQTSRNDAPHPVNGTSGLHSSQSAPSLPPPPASGTSTSSSLPYPPTSSSSVGSGSWRNSQDTLRPTEERRFSGADAYRDQDRERDRYSRPPRDPRDYDYSRGRTDDRDRRYARSQSRDRGRSGEGSRDGGWGYRGRR